MPTSSSTCSPPRTGWTSWSAWRASASRGRPSAESTWWPAFGPSCGRSWPPTRHQPAWSGSRSRSGGVAALDLPATQHDVVVWLAGASYDVVFDTSRSIVAELMGRATLAHEMVGWQYHHDRDLTGFEDGSENPSIVEATSVALVPSGLPGEGASILLLQQWEHDAIAWDALPVASQEEIIGRRKSDSLELDPRPPTSHVTRTDQERFGKIFRRNVAYGTMSQHGTIFVGFCGSQGPLSQMLESMVGTRLRATRPTDQRRPCGHRRLLRHPDGRPVGGVRFGGSPVTDAP